MTDPSALLGTWKMVSWQREVLATGEQFDALGPDRLAVLDYGQDAIKAIGAGEAFAVRSADGAVAKARADDVSACGADESITLRFVSYQA